MLEIAMEEVNGKVPILAGTWAITTDETVETARDCKALGVDGIFVTPPGGAQDVTSCWDADNYPEIWLDQIIAQDRAVDLPIVTHPVGGAKPPFYPGLPLEATLRICREVPNVVGLEDDVHVRRLPVDRQGAARPRPPCRGDGRARLAVP